MKQTVSLHGMSFRRTIGLHPEEQLLLTRFEADADITLPAGGPFVDYSLIQELTTAVFDRGFSTLEALCTTLVQHLKKAFPQAQNVRVCIRKYRPPLPGEVGYAQVCLEG